MPGVVRTRVGFAGGTAKNPTYQKIGDHTEVIQIDYDPEKISYEQLAKVFWATHNACQVPFSRQYMSLILYHNDEQKKIALETGLAEEKRRGQKIMTVLLPMGKFYMAEDYHQKHYLRQNPGFFKEFLTYYPKRDDFYNSTAVTRVNGYLGGSGSAEALLKEIDSYGLSPIARETLLRTVKK